LYLETVAVDKRGIVDPRMVSKKDVEILKRWNVEGFVFSKRYSAKVTCAIHLTYVVWLSDGAWEAAHRERKARAYRTASAEIDRDALILNEGGDA